MGATTSFRVKMAVVEYRWVTASGVTSDDAIEDAKANHEGQPVEAWLAHHPDLPEEAKPD